MSDVLQTILDSGIIAIIRSDSPSGLVATARALAAGGVRALEVTLTTPGALEAISAVARQSAGRFLVGAGSVPDADAAQRAIDAGAEFLVAPNVDAPTIELARRKGKVVCPGAFTPTEIVAAWRAGADIVKVFPASFVGPAYLRALRGPLPQVRYMPVGGVSLDNAGEYIRAGACAVGVGGALVNREVIAAGDWAQITASAARYVEAVARASQ